MFWNIDQNTDHENTHYQGAAAIANERKRYSLCRQEPDHHTDIQEALNEDNGCHTEGEIASKIVWAIQSDLESLDHQEQQQPNHDKNP